MNDTSIDLHGMTCEEVREVLLNFLGLRDRGGWGRVDVIMGNGDVLKPFVKKMLDDAGYEWEESWHGGSLSVVV